MAIHMNSLTAMIGEPTKLTFIYDRWGNTTALAKTPTRTVTGVAVLHPKDAKVFCKATGRKVAFKHLLDTLQLDRVSRSAAWSELFYRCPTTVR